MAGVLYCSRCGTGLSTDGTNVWVLYYDQDLSNNLYRTMGVPPYDGDIQPDNWTSATLLSSLPANKISAVANPVDGVLPVFWTNGSSSPYGIQAESISVTQTTSATTSLLNTKSSHITVSDNVQWAVENITGRNI